MEGKMRKRISGQWSVASDQKLKRPFIFLLLFTVVMGCAAKRAEVKPSQIDYLATLNQWTKAQKVYDGLDTKLHIYVTYKTWAFRMAYVDEYAKRYLLDETQKKDLLEREREVNDRFNEFFIAAYTPDARWNDFDKKGSIWTIYMEDDKGNRLRPIEVKKVDETDPLIREFFPYLGLWSLGYVVRFPKYLPVGDEPFPGKDVKSFNLIVAGVLGRAELQWRLGP